jgi:hypothetical protein
VSEQVAWWLRVAGGGFEPVPYYRAHWDDYTQDERDNFDVEWPQYLSGIEWLDRQVRSGTMTSDELAAYEAVLVKVRQALPLLDAMGLERSTISLDPLPVARTR